MTAEDEREVSRILMAYAMALDRRNWILFRDCFSPDVVADYVGIARLEGIEPYLTFMMDGLSRLGPTLHRVTNVVVSGNSVRADSASYVDAVRLHEPSDGTVLHAIGTYQDVFRRERDGWRISSRLYTPFVNSRFSACD